MGEIGLMKQLGTMKKYHSEGEDVFQVGEHLLSGVWSSEAQVGSPLLGKNKRRQKQRNKCYKPP
jgi:hypothetical protein